MMKPLRLALGGLVWLVAGLLGAVGLLLSVTIILLPLGIPVLMLSRRLFSLAGVIVLPRRVRHPVKEARKQTREKGSEALARTTSVLPKRSRSRVARLRKRSKKRMSGARRRLTRA